MIDHFRPGDLVEVLPANDIFSSLDSNGTLDGLTFMPEMLEFCQNQYTISKRVVQVTFDALGIPTYNESYVREFKKNDVYFIDELRCCGTEHGRCQRGCKIFWKKAWIKKPEAVVEIKRPNLSDVENSKFDIKTKSETGTYFCQSSQLQYATDHMSKFRRIIKCVNSVNAGNNSAFEMMKGLSKWCKSKTHQKLIGPYPRGSQKTTPIESIGLNAGDMVEVKSLEEIIKTLDKNGMNRGLHFSADMIPFCEKRFRVQSSADRLITEGTGQMRKIPHTVILENVTCDGFFYAFGGCPRNDFQYWREIWLKRVA